MPTAAGELPLFSTSAPRRRPIDGDFNRWVAVCRRRRTGGALCRYSVPPRARPPRATLSFSCSQAAGEDTNNDGGCSGRSATMTTAISSSTSTSTSRSSLAADVHDLTSSTGPPLYYWRLPRSSMAAPAVTASLPPRPAASITLFFLAHSTTFFLRLIC